LTDIFGKRFEKIVSARLVSELESGGFDDSQFAYLRSRSATQAVLSLVELVKSNVLAGNMVGVLFFDFADAFGSVNRVKLIGELIKSFGITGKLLKYLVGFLSGRYVRITVNDLIGGWIISDIGTSTGTILEEILFLVYVHDIPKSIHPKFDTDLASIIVC